MIYQPATETNSFRQWEKAEWSFTSDFSYQNPLYDVNFYVVFTAPSGNIIKINGFWDGGTCWKVRLMPHETGEWQYQTFCSNTANQALHERRGRFNCEASSLPLSICQRGAITRHAEKHYLQHADGTPFLWIGCTAWNGTLKSTAAEWEHYLQHRAAHGYSVIQFITTQWRGCDMNSQLQRAYHGTKKIAINPVFFRHLDEKIDRINAYGLLAAPVLLWALPYGQGRSLSPGVQLPKEDAVQLARYMVARYGANHIIWLLGGDGLYTHVNEKRWKYIGQQVFGEPHPGLVALHAMGRSWIGDAYKDEAWLDIIGYQSGHSSDRRALESITQGQAAKGWSRLPPRAFINMESCYEEINHQVDSHDVREASYHSLFATPVAGISYGANGLWPWIRRGEKIMNHGALADKEPSPWKESLELPGSRQIGYLSAFMRQLDWHSLLPASALLTKQPGTKQYQQFISLVGNEKHTLLLAYLPAGTVADIRNAGGFSYRMRWFDPQEGKFIASAEQLISGEILRCAPPEASDFVLVLERASSQA